MSSNNIYKKPESWEVVKLGAFVESEKGKKPENQVNQKSQSYSLPYIDIQAFEKGIISSWTDGKNCQICQESDLLMVWDGSRSGLVGKSMKGALGSTLVRINFPLIENQYAFYFLQYKYLEINTRTKGTGTPHVDSNLLWNYDFPIPPINEQRRIVAKVEELFSELDKGIEQLKTVRTKLNIYRQAVLKYAFEGKLTAKWRKKNKDKLEAPEQLLGRIKREREIFYEQQEQEWKTNVKIWEEDGNHGKKPVKPRKPTPIFLTGGEPSKNLPAIAECWLWLRLKQVGRIETGTTPSTKNPKNYGGNLPFLKPADLDQGGHIQTAQDYLSELGAESARVLPAYSTLVTCIGATIGKTGFTRTKCATNQQINSISPHPGFNPRFVYFQALAPFFNGKVKSEASVTTIPILNKSKFEKLPFLFCALAEQEQIVCLLEERFAVIEQQEQKIDSVLKQVATLRQAILKKAFSGQLVAQNPNDEPASVLLNRIRVKREKFMRNNNPKKIKRRKTLP